jgi:multisubunit Na+/H+ antiporter MnhB subunit
MLENDSFILRKSSTMIALIVQIFAVYLFFRGHNQPGGGFIAGVASGIGMLLLILANGRDIVPRICPFDPLRLCGWGLAVATASGLAGLVVSGAFLTHYHYKDTEFPVLGSIYLGTPLVFDLGVFLVVVGVILKISLVLLDALQGQDSLHQPAFSIPVGDTEKPMEHTEKDYGRTPS